jgi:hypothetical protein
MKIGIVGSRRRNKGSDFAALVSIFKEIYKEGDTIVSGGCPTGGDRFAQELAEKVGYTITIHYPNKKRDGIPACFFIRNTKIAEDCDVLIAIVSKDRTGGTEDTVKKVLAMGKKVIYV